MRAYAVFINEQALATAPRSGPQRESVMNLIRSLADKPKHRRRFYGKRRRQPDRSSEIDGRYAVTFWADHAVSEIKVTHLKSADK